MIFFISFLCVILLASPAYAEKDREGRAQVHTWVESETIVTEPAEPTEIQKNQAKNLSEFAIIVFDPEIERIDSLFRVSEKILLDRFGKPENIELRKEKDLRAVVPTVLDVQVWKYDGLIITIKEAVYDTFYIDKIVLTSPDYNLVNGLRVGFSKRQFMEVLGLGSSRSKKLYYAACFDKFTDGWRGGRTMIRSCKRVVIEMDENETVKKITWESEEGH